MYISYKQNLVRASHLAKTNGTVAVLKRKQEHNTKNKGKDNRPPINSFKQALHLRNRMKKKEGLRNKKNGKARQ